VKDDAGRVAGCSHSTSPMLLDAEFGLTRMAPGTRMGRDYSGRDRTRQCGHAGACAACSAPPLPREMEGQGPPCPRWNAAAIYFSTRWMAFFPCHFSLTPSSGGSMLIFKRGHRFGPVSNPG